MRQEWLENLNNIQEPFNEIMHSLMLQIMGWLAEEESQKKSERVKVQSKSWGKTFSKFGKVWGRKSIISNRIISKVKELKTQGLSLRQIKDIEVYFMILIKINDKFQSDYSQNFKQQWMIAVQKWWYTFYPLNS